MNKLTLRDSAALAEIIASIGVVVSLLFVAVTINDNTSQIRADHSNELYESARQVELAVAADAEWSRIVHAVPGGNAQLSDVEQFRFDVYAAAMVDLWDQLLSRYSSGHFEASTYVGWDEYFQAWSRRFLTREDWERIRWQYEGSDAAERIDELAPFRTE